MFYDHRAIEEKWQNYWKKNATYRTGTDPNKAKYYVLDMFPYPSGAGLHVGHPLGYIASDICARVARHEGKNVLHPIGYDSFGLPAEQYAIQTGTHPAVTTRANIERYEQQLRRLGFSFDWKRELRTSDKEYYRWTQWIFIQLFHSWYNEETDRAEGIDSLISYLENNGTQGLKAAQTEALDISASDWKALSESEKEEVLLNYRLAFRAETSVNWCPGLGSVLANDEIKDGKSERGGFPVYQKKMMQWSMRITAYSERLLNGLKDLDWPQALKDAQEYWIGKSQGAQLKFNVEKSQHHIEVFTTRPDTIFGVTFMVLAPENPLVEQITTPEQKETVEAYRHETSMKTERDRMADVKTTSGAFTGAYAVHPFTQKKIPIYISSYVLMGYGTGAVMAVPAHDERDHRFAKKFGLDITQVIDADTDIQEAAYDSKDSVCINSDFLDGLNYTEASERIISEIEDRGIGFGATTYRQRDAIFSRQRYWGEPVPIYYKEGQPYTLPETALPLILPEVNKYLPTEDGDPPLGNAKEYAWDEANQRIAPTESIDHINIFPLELSTMPGWAGSSWYFLRYTDPNNSGVFASKEALDYWKSVDLYIGGAEHATGHLLYSRFWTMFLYDRGYIFHKEPFQKLINQGMILGMSALVHRVEGKNIFVSEGLAKDFSTQRLHIDVSLLKGTSNELDIEAFRNWRSEFKDAEFILENGKFITEREVEKMSKSKFNVINPDEIADQYGADCLRMYEMFLGPLEQSKPWNTQGLSGVYGFLKKFWNLYFDGNDFKVIDIPPTPDELRILHTLIKKVRHDISNFSFNTTVSSFMIAVNDLHKIGTRNRTILESMAILISPYAPHIAEEIWSLLGHKESIEYQAFPELQEKYLVQSEIEYPVSFNGKLRFKILLPADLDKDEVQKQVLENEKTIEILTGLSPKKIIVVPGKIVNIVV